MGAVEQSVVKSVGEEGAAGLIMSAYASVGSGGVTVSQEFVVAFQVNVGVVALP